VICATSDGRGVYVTVPVEHRSRSRERELFTLVFEVKGWKPFGHERCLEIDVNR